MKYAVAIQIDRLRGDGLDLQRARDAQAKRLAFDDADERRLVGRGIEMRAARLATKEAVRSAALVSDRAVATCRSNACTMSCAAGPSIFTAVSRQRERCIFCTPVVHSRPTPTPPVMPIAVVDDEQLSVIARNEPEPAAEAGRVEDGDLDAAHRAAIEGTCATCRARRSNRAEAARRRRV